MTSTRMAVTIIENIHAVIEAIRDQMCLPLLLIRVTLFYKCSPDVVSILLVLMGSALAQICLPTMYSNNIYIWACNLWQ